MHLTRPKSSKGRSRPAANNSLHTGDRDSNQRLPVSTVAPIYGRPDRNFRSQSQPIMWQANSLGQSQGLHMLHHAAAAPPQSLNKYRVLPSIERRRSVVSPDESLRKNMSSLSLSGAAATVQQRQRHEGPGLRTAHTISSEGGDGTEKPPKPPDLAPTVTKEGTGTLLLAVRAPCGRRFQENFEPEDTLLKVKTTAEARYGAKYGEVSIETMDVPRRSFADMDMTLAQCGILNRSVLCICQNSDSLMEHESI
ncbi:UBX domain-containing protein 10 [Mastacembelus armatus]|nr:UBX domain-containing protein 10 [Mastacembelus armatus]